MSGSKWDWGSEWMGVCESGWEWLVVDESGWEHG